MRWQKIAKKISERTGLKSDEEIMAYSYFCKNADLNNCIILYGDVKHGFYTSLLEYASVPMKKLESAYWNSVGNHEKTGEHENRLESPLSKQAKELYGKYSVQFTERGLISPPEKTAYSQEYYPRLNGYNYFNDSEFYRANGNSRTSI